MVVVGFSNCSGDCVADHPPRPTDAVELKRTAPKLGLRMRLVGDKCRLSGNTVSVASGLIVERRSGSTIKNQQIAVGHRRGRRTECVT